MKVYAWRLSQDYIHPENIVEPGYTLCYSAQWLSKREVMFDSVQRTKPDKMFAGIHALLDEADAVCHYNGEKFDIPVLRAEFMERHMPPPSPFKQIDLLKTMRTAGFPSKKLDYITRRMGLARKMKHKGMELWRGCMDGDESSWRIMERYNKQDVRCLRELHDEIRPWIRNYPNAGIYDDRQCCPVCAKNRVQSRGEYVSRLKKYRKFHCQNCFAWLYLINGKLQTGKQPYRLAA